MTVIDNTFDHTGFVTPNMDVTIAFWTEVIGLEARSDVERTGDWIAAFTGIAGAKLRIAHLFGEGVHLEFIQFLAAGVPASLPDPAAPCTAHVCIRVDDPQVCLDRMISFGATPVGRVTTITEGAAAGLTGCYLRDPNGILIELLQRA
jgi:catechol 2,3-dioxygenase-like lactoylglutathione lyase family enzyme